MSGHTGTTTDGRAAGPRCVAIVGPHGSGKTTLLEAILERTGAIPKAGNVAAGSSVGDRSKEARAHGMGIDLNAADAEFLGDRYTFLDCPGFVEFAFEMQPVLAVADVAVVRLRGGREEDPGPATGAPAARSGGRSSRAVCEQDRQGRRHASRYLEADANRHRPRRWCCARFRSGRMARPSAPSSWPSNGRWSTANTPKDQEVPIPSDHQADELAARYEMLERLADYDDDLMEELLSDVAPDRSQIFQDLRNEMRSGQITPVFVGSAERG